ncbi:hypothetical protein AMTRI_Chr08g163750 [Amborella trichopoda]
MDHVSDIKLIRTDTTLDLRQKAEKGTLCNGFVVYFYSPYVPSTSQTVDVGLKLYTNALSM